MSATTFWGNLKDNLWTNNPIFIQILGICSTLAVTNNLVNTTIMTVALVFVTSFSNVTISLIRNLVPRKLRMITQTVIISFFVIIVDIMLRAYYPEIHKNLAAYVGLIITNCIVMGRMEAFAQANPPLISFWDGFTSGLGYMAVLMVIAFVRELLGFGTLFGFTVLPIYNPVDGTGWFTPWGIMVTPASAFFLLAGIIWAAKAIMNRPVTIKAPAPSQAQPVAAGGKA
jgi:Na+-transporting NADH:ubiquinone oxidoreductase subunit D